MTTVHLSLYYGIKISLVEFDNVFGYDRSNPYMKFRTCLEDISNSNSVVDVIEIDKQKVNLYFYVINKTNGILVIYINSFEIGHEQLVPIDYNAVLLADLNYNKIASKISKYQHLLELYEPKLWIFRI